MILLPLTFKAHIDLVPGDHVCITVESKHVGDNPRDLALIGDYWIEVTRPWKKGQWAHEAGYRMDAPSDTGLTLHH